MSETAAAKDVAYIFSPREQPTVEIEREAAVYPVHRIFCVGRNYADHAKEMGVEVDREAPFYFTKPHTAIVASGTTIQYPLQTANYHHEVELVVALGRAAHEIRAEQALDAVFGYAVGLDMTRRDLQLDARAKGRPWDIGKAFEQSAVMGAIRRREAFGQIGSQRITLTLNDVTKQDAKLSDLIWSVPEIIAHLSRYYHLDAGDLIYTGTPAGVGPVVAGDRLVGSIDGLSPVQLTIKK